MSASDWNLIASEVNRIWGSEAGPGLRLTKGEPWRISSTAAIGSASLEFNGPVWQIYVYRPTGADDYDVNAAPSAIFLTGPFTQTGTVNTKRIARLKWNGSRTVADAQFAANGGINLATGGQYLQQRMAKVPATGAMLFLGQTSDSTWLDGDNGVFWAANPTTGQRLFSPWASVESVAPGYRDDSPTGIASYGDTIAVSSGIISGINPGLMLFNTSGNPVEVSSGNYVFKDSISSSYYWLIASPGVGYLFESKAGEGTQPYVHQITGTVAGGIDFDATWQANVIAGDEADRAAPPILDAGRNYLMMTLSPTGWQDTGSVHYPVTPMSQIQVTGANRGLYIGDLSVIGLFDSMIPLSAGPTPTPYGSADCIFQKSDQTELHLYLDGFLTTLTVSNGDFNGVVVDAKYFRQRSDGTHQIIVCGEFTEYKGEPAPYLVFIDQYGNRLSDLEWP